MKALDNPSSQAPEKSAAGCTVAWGRLGLKSNAGRFILVAGVLLVCGLWSVAAAERPTLAEVNAAIEANDWSWEADDMFVRSLSRAELENLNGFVITPEYEREWAERLRTLPVAKDGFPPSFDWRESGGVTPVKNQGGCGSCWAFSSTAELESFIKIYYNRELDLSEQQVISCNEYGADCGGGWTGAAYSVFADYGAVSEHCEPYQGLDPPEVPCRQNEYFPYGFVTNWHSVPNNVDQIKAALMTGPVCTSICGGSYLQDYSGGCFDVFGGETNHSVLIVGYDDRRCDGRGAWIIKNSWGPEWGIYGFGYIQYGAASIGSYATQLEYTPPPTQVIVTSPAGSDPIYGDIDHEITWLTLGDPVTTVDIWFSPYDGCHEWPVALGEANDGQYVWAVPNEATTSGSLVLMPTEGTTAGFGFTPNPVVIIGHRIRYVSAAGSNTPPFDTPATAAHTITDAVLACTGLDSVMVAGGDYEETVTVSSTIQIYGGWNEDFTLRDRTVFPTRLRGTNSAVRFFPGAGNYGGIDGIEFHDCMGGNYGSPINGRHGGAIYSSNASPWLHDCTFNDNRAAPPGIDGYGGAILCVGGSPRIEGCRFAGNVAARGGAVALFDVADAILRANDFQYNTCSDSSDGYFGAAIYLSGSAALIDDVVLQANGGAGKGGGIATEGGAVTVTGATLTGNRSQLAGGALFATETDLAVTGAVIEGNVCAAGDGGGLAVFDGSVSVRNLRCRDNAAQGLGGGLLLLGVSSGTVENCLIAGNGAPVGAGAMISAGDGFLLRNNIISGNEGDGLLAAGGLVADYNDVFGNTGNDYAGGIPGPHDIAADPLFVAPDEGDFGLAVHSPCIDRGDPDPGHTDPDGSRADIGSHGGPGALAIAPAAVAGISLQDMGGGTLAVSWAAGAEPNLDYYVVYCDTTEVFFPSTTNAIATVEHPQTSVQDTPAHPCYYLVAAVDTEGHCGGFSPRVMSDGQVAAAPVNELPVALAVTSVVPNPFNPRTTIHYDVPQAAFVSVRIFDLRGRLVTTLVHRRSEPGRYNVLWDGTDSSAAAVAAGVYFVQVSDGRSASTGKLVLAK